MVATPKFTELEEAWNNLYAGSNKGVASTLVLQTLLENKQKAKYGGTILRLTYKKGPQTRQNRRAMQDAWHGQHKECVD